MEGSQGEIDPPRRADRHTHRCPDNGGEGKPEYVRAECLGDRGCQHAFAVQSRDGR